jgi:hypothetical protein
LVFERVKFAKHIMVSASAMLACVTAARKDCILIPFSRLNVKLIAELSYPDSLKTR